jgi:metal-responsive CopG/Arc/MetJ family transcriptional regulator
MIPARPQDKTRLNIQLPAEIKERLSEASSRQGKKVSVLVRESIEEKLRQIEKKVFEDRMKAAYLDMADENLEISDDFKYADAENLPGDAP